MLFLFCIFRHEGVYLAWVVDAGQKKDILYIAFSSAFECPIVFNIAIVARLYFLQKSKMCHTLFFGQKYVWILQKRVREGDPSEQDVALFVKIPQENKHHANH